MPRVARRIASVSSWLMVWVVVGIAVSFIVLTTGFGWQFSTVLTGSMTPKYPIGSIAVIVPASPDEIRVGDVITFNMEGRRISHRVTAVTDAPNGRSFTTKGDANNATDRQPVPAGNVVGQVKADIPWLGDLLLWIRTPLGIGITTSTFVGSLIFSAVTRKGRKSLEEPAAA